METSIFDRGTYLRRGFRIFFLATVVSAAVTVVAKSPPVDLRPNLAVSLVLSLIFGPFACLAVNVINSITNILNDVPYKSCAMYLATVMVVTYFPTGCDTASACGTTPCPLRRSRPFVT